MTALLKIWCRYDLVSSDRVMENRKRLRVTADSIQAHFVLVVSWTGRSVCSARDLDALCTCDVRGLNCPKLT